ncbi:hypothetical protein GCM10009718_17000 [Isoptericola halotolerans]|uniref:DUF3566 domain-containing protein n=1 Tax=Isoptericola halotolerans TaxID=300560 RepID=A0ABX2A7Y2_9MICO|nr:DUF3566 domain-containing protein [Isoptericola halotolerans]NOV98711.1 hypothetical protein [Isoptericola halotolerans]
MASDNTAGRTGTTTALAADSTQQMPPVPAAPTANGSTAPGAAAQSGVPAATPVASVAPPPAPADVSSPAAPPENGSTVKEGAVKAAAAALAAARSAAKKVQSATSASSSTGSDAPDAANAGTPSTSAPSASSTQSGPRPEMHYSAGGVHGTAAPEASPGGAQYAAGTAQPQAQPAAPAEVGSPRRVRLSVSRVDPWSIMKLAFLLSVAVGIMIVVATGVVWYSLNSFGTFAVIQDFLVETMGPQTIDIMQFVEFDRMISLATLIALVNMVLFTALATIMAILYNITAALVGGVHLTLTDD